LTLPPFGRQLQQGHGLVVGASQGIGLGFVTALLADDRITQLYAAYRTPITASGLLNLNHPKLTCVPMEATDEAQIAAAIARIRQDSDRLDLVINCVGLLHSNQVQPEKSLRQIDAEQLLTYFQVNSIPTVLLAKHLVPC
jgi:NAD(P)-dependent dehydrogenase (short-subunit alcohol dehydrogenase family)